jgi:hypothetical protein
MSPSVAIPHDSKLVRWFAEKYYADRASFPGIGKFDYVTAFLNVENTLNATVHTKTEVFARIADAQGYLTDHGPDHIRMVMHRASKIIHSEPGMNKPFDTELTPYEVFLLLMAIHFHDVGNRYGREGHETKILQTMATIPQMASFGTAEQRAIARIASTHGGRVDHDKDTIRKILPEGSQTISGTMYRPQMIAAILRLADELAEDSTRADTFALLNPAEIPPESRLYHKYAQRLDSIHIMPEEKKVNMEFSVYEEEIKNKYGYHIDRSGTVATKYLLDEILLRTKKTFLEAIYCNNFLREECKRSFTTISVTIRPFRSLNSIEPFRDPIRYSIKEKGYPFDHQKVSLLKLCPELEGINGKRLRKQLAAAT